jgi:hypothetical protein
MLVTTADWPAHGQAEQQALLVLQRLMTAGNAIVMA